MDNDREVDKRDKTTDIVERSKMVFLREIIDEFSRRQQQYDLEEEFSKTRKNRSVMIPLLIAGLIVVFGVVVTAVTSYIQSSSLAIQVDIDDFADVNLRDILDEAQRLQNQLDAAERELQELRQERETRIAQIERARDREVSLLEEADLTARGRADRAEELNLEAAQRIEAVEAEVAPRIEELEARISRLEEDIRQYDSRQLEQAREQEEILNNQQRRFDLEMKETRERYEQQIDRLTSDYEREIDELERFQEEFARTIRNRHQEELARLRAQHRREIAELTLLYNPVMDEEPLNTLLAETAPAEVDAFTGPGGFRAVLDQEGAIDRGGFTAIGEQYADFLTILDRLQEIPFENSVPAALDQLETRVQDVVYRYDRLWRVLADSVESRDEIIAQREATIDEREETIARHRHALNELSRFQGDTGYIIDSRDDDAILVYVNPIISVTPGTVGYVFRRDDEYVGTIKFNSGQDPVTARVDQTVDGMQVRAFDKVLIEVQEDDRDGS